MWSAATTMGPNTDDDGPQYYGLSILEFRGEKAAHETIYGWEAREAPQWRAVW
jgi:hypothetical protein